MSNRMQLLRHVPQGLREVVAVLTVPAISRAAHEPVVVFVI